MPTFVRDRFTWLAYLMLGYYAYLQAANGPLMPFLRADLGINYTTGGLHFSAGKQEMLPFVYLDGQDLKALGRLLDMGLELFAQQVPGGRRHAVGRGQLQEMGGRL